MIRGKGTAPQPEFKPLSSYPFRDGATYVTRGGTFYITLCNDGREFVVCIYGDREPELLHATHPTANMVLPVDLVVSTRS